MEAHQVAVDAEHNLMHAPPIRRASALNPWMASITMPP